MDLQITEPEIDPLLAFCKRVVDRYAQDWPPSENQLALEFVSFFPLEPLIRLEDLTRFCGRLGIEVSVSALPDGLQGMNASVGSNRSIFLSNEGAFPGSEEHTLLHELRELIEYLLCDLGYPTEKGQGLEARAEEFASHARSIAALKEFQVLFEKAARIESGWKRWLACAFVILLGISYSATCVLLPAFEDRISRSSQVPVLKPRRNSR